MSLQYTLFHLTFFLFYVSAFYFISFLISSYFSTFHSFPFLLSFSCRASAFHLLPYYSAFHFLFHGSFLSRISKKKKDENQCISTLSLSLITIDLLEGRSNDANELDSVRQRREIENGWTGRKWSVRGSRREREGGEGTVLDAFAKPLETVLHNNLLEKWQRDAKMSETTPNSDDFFPPLRST